MKVEALLSLLQEERRLIEQQRVEDLGRLLPRLKEAIKGLMAHPPGVGELEGLAEEVKGLAELLEAKRREVLDRAHRLRGVKQAIRGYLQVGKPSARFVDRWLR